MTKYELLLADAADLPVAERIQLIEAIWDTVPDESLPSLSEEWMIEIERRSAEFDSGFVQTVPWENIKTDAMRRLARKSD